MPFYRYKAMNDKGLIVNNRVEELNKYVLLKKLKSNKLLPIQVTQIKVNKKASRKMKTHRKNIESNDSVLKSFREKEIERNMKSTKKLFAEKAKKVLFSNIKITNKDVTVFTQNFYLLKKANFNNIHALTTVIESTENESFKGILEDILIGVEAGENMYVTMEYYTGVFPPIYINMIKFGELSGSLVKSL